MAIEYTIEVPGLDQLNRAFKEMPHKVVPRLDRAVKEAAITLQRESRIITPVDTGRLRQSIQVRLNTLEATVGPTVNYAAAVHDGVKPKLGIDGKRATKGRKGRPFMTQAIGISDSKIRGFFKEAVNDIVREVLKNE